MYPHILNADCLAAPVGGTRVCLICELYLQTHLRPFQHTISLILCTTTETLDAPRLLISSAFCDAIVSPGQQLPLASISQKISLLLYLTMFFYDQNEFSHCNNKTKYH